MPSSLRRKRFAVLAVFALLAGGTPSVSPAMAQTRASATAAPMTDYVVRPGDTLSQIGERLFAVPENWRRVQTMNNVADAHRLRIGSVLRIPTAFFRMSNAAARIAAFQGPVSVGQPGETAAPRLDQAVGEGDLLETGPNAFLRIALSDGGAIIVPSNTRLRVDRLRANAVTGGLEQSFSVLRGRVESRVARVRNGGAYTVRTPVSVSAVRGTVYRTSFDEGLGRATAEVLEGGVAVEAAGAAAEVAIGMGAVMNAAGVAVKPLPPRPYLIDPDTPRSLAEVAFNIIPVPGAVAYRALVAVDPTLTQVMAEAESQGSEARVVFSSLPDGFHYLSLTSVDADGLESPASVYDFLRVRNVVRDLKAERAPAPRDHIFSWASDGAAAPRYRFELGRPGEPPLIEREALKEDHLEIPDLKPGTYVWRVRATRTVQGQMVYVWSDPQTLTVRR